MTLLHDSSVCATGVMVELQDVIVMVDLWDAIIYIFLYTEIVNNVLTDFQRSSLVSFCFLNLILPIKFSSRWWLLFISLLFFPLYLPAHAHKQLMLPFLWSQSLQSSSCHNCTQANNAAFSVFSIFTSLAITERMILLHNHFSCQLTILVWSTEKERELGAAHCEIKALKVAELLKDKVVVKVKTN